MGKWNKVRKIFVRADEDFIFQVSGIDAALCRLADIGHRSFG